MLSDDALRAAIVAFFESPEAWACAANARARARARSSVVDFTNLTMCLNDALPRALYSDAGVRIQLSEHCDGADTLALVPYSLKVYSPLGIEARIVNGAWQVTLTNSSTPATDSAVTKEPAYVWVAAMGPQRPTRVDASSYALFPAASFVDAAAVKSHLRLQTQISAEIAQIPDPGYRNDRSFGSALGLFRVDTPEGRAIADSLELAKTTVADPPPSASAEPASTWASLFANGDIRIQKEKPVEWTYYAAVVAIPDVGAPPGLYMVSHARNAELRALVDEALAHSSSKIETNESASDAPQSEEQVMQAWIQQWYAEGRVLYTVSKTKALATALRVEDARPQGQPRQIEVPDNFVSWDSWKSFDYTADGVRFGDLYDNAAPTVAVEGDPPSRKERLKTQGKQLGAILLEGSAMAAVDQSGEAILKAADKWAQAVPNDRAWLHDLLKTPRGRDLVKLTVALVVHTLAHQTDFVPKPEIVSKVAELQLKASSFKFVGENLGVLFELLGEFVTIGQALPKGMLAEDSEDTADIFSHLGEKVRASS